MRILRLMGVVIFALSLILFIGYLGCQYAFEDKDVPIISCESDSITLSTKTPIEEYLKGVSAYDEKDGDVTKSIVVESVSKMNLDKSRTITYAAFDADKHVSKLTRILKYKDYQSPHFGLSKPLVFQVGETNLSMNLTAQDNIDGNLTDKIKYITNDEEIISKAGKYLVEFQVTNSAGETAFLPATVEFINFNEQLDIKPIITLTHYLIYIKKGSSFEAKDFLKEVDIEGEQYDVSKYASSTTKKGISKDMITVSADVNASACGVYSVDYKITTKDGQEGDTKLIVVVEE